MKQKNLLIFFFLLGLFAQSFSQTILAPDLQCVKNNNVNGDITLYWTNPPVNPCGAFVQYTIYASSTRPNGPFDSIVSVPQQSATSFVLPNYLGVSSNWYFYMEADYSCPGATVLQSDTVDNHNPTTPTIINVDVTPGNHVIFNWMPSPSPQTAFYIIYYFLSNGNALPLDTVYGRFNTTFTDTAADPTSASYVYTIAAVDSCGGISAYSTLPHNTIFMQVSTTACQKEIDISWNKYINWVPGVLEYQIYASVNQSPYTFDGSVDSNTTTYGFTHFNDQDSVSLFVRAVSIADTDVVSNSNIFSLKASIVQPPAYIYMTNATVNTANQVEMTWDIDSAAQLIFFKISQSGNNISYDPLAQLSAFSPLAQFQSYIDSSGMPDHNPYYYIVTAVDSCQNQYPTPYVKTVCLKGDLYDYYVTNVTWNDFELQGATVIAYKLYRNYGSGYQLIHTFPPGTNTYSDSLQQFLNEKGIFCYRIEAVYSIDLPLANYHATLSSWSNEICIIHRPIIYIPNAFSPSSPVPENTVFKPTMYFNTEPKAYTMQIYNRWGGLVFATNDHNAGWDGTDHGKEAQQGGYAYLIQFYAEDGVKVERKGMVLLVR